MGSLQKNAMRDDEKALPSLAFVRRPVFEAGQPCKKNGPPKRPKSREETPKKGTQREALRLDTV
jgi:hypothetical protein